MRSFRPRSDLWRDRGFVKLWAANGISQLGTQVSLLALPLAALYTLNAGALAVALLRSFAVLPFLPDRRPRAQGSPAFTPPEIALKLDAGSSQARPIHIKPLDSCPWRR